MPVTIPLPNFSQACSHVATLGPDGRISNEPLLAGAKAAVERSLAAMSSGAGSGLALRCLALAYKVSSPPAPHHHSPSFSSLSHVFRPHKLDCVTLHIICVRLSYIDLIYPFLTLVDRL